MKDIIGPLPNRYIRVNFETMNNSSSTIDFIINVYAEPLTPNDFFAGELTNTSMHTHKERIVEENSGRYSFHWDDFRNGITRIEARDQSVGNGGEVVFLRNGGINTTYVEIVFTSVYNNSRIDFIVDIYGDLNFPAPEVCKIILPPLLPPVNVVDF